MLRVKAVAVLGLIAVLLGQPGVASAATPVTYQDQTYPTASGSPSADKPQSKLWYNDGSWWGLLRTSAGVTIHRLVKHAWTNTGVVVDNRLAATGDALWDGTRLYVASRVASGAPRVIGFTYDTATDTYRPSFTKTLSSTGTESITVAKDSLGRLWVSYTQASRVYVAHSTTSPTTWTAPFLVPVADNTVTSDDISAVIAFGGKVGVMYSDQGNDVMYFAVHQDTAGDGVWTLERALSGPNVADDHINLKSLLQDDAGRLYAAIKTSRGDAGEPTTDPSVVVLQRSSTGTWTSAVAAQVGDRLTRPQLALDSTNRRLIIVMAKEGGGTTIYYKTTALGALSFAAGRGAPFITWAGSLLNDPSTTKQGVNAGTGLVVLATDDRTGYKRYYHGELALT